MLESPASIKNVAKIKSVHTEQFVHVVKNLYAVSTALGGSAKTSTIEDLFDPEVKAAVINGKRFHTGNDFDDTKHYGKAVFAHRVVRQQAATIDFSGFRQLLINLVAAIQEHRVFMAPTTGPDPN